VSLTIHYTLSGTAVNGIDYVSLPGSVSIPAGAASASVTVTPINDTLVEGNETVVLSLSADAAYTVGSPNAGIIIISDNDSAPVKATVTVAATDASASEAGPDTGRFTISRTGDTTVSLTIHYTLSGTAVNGTDYVSLSGSLSIPAGATSATVTVAPIDDTLVEGNESVILTLSSDTTYTVGSPGSAIVTIADNDFTTPIPVVSMTATDMVASEPGTDTATVTISRSVASSTSLTVHYTIAGTAVNGVDFQALSGTATIPAGASSVDVVVRPLDDNLIEVGELVILTLSPSDSYTVGLLNSVVITILDNDFLLLGTDPVLDAP
jgi:hypothetical protein